jgi:tRNA A-37 threonylcarbamoyl transferase component Bud32
MRTPVPMTNSLFSNLIRALDEAEAERARQRGTAGQLVPGDRLGEYVLREHVATGGFGAVWRAEHPSSGKEVAVKVLHSYLVSSEDAVTRFEREIRVIARMQHPNIVELLDCGRLDDGRPYLVTEFLRGIDLDTHIEQHGALSPELALNILEQLCAALAAAHAQKIVHRDVKASNVLLSERDGQMRVVLVDFGVAKLIDDSNPGLTVSNVLVGSLACLSPEQIRNRPVNARTDVYALGSLAYHMLTGEPPFAYASVTEIINLHLDRDPPVPSSICAIPAALDAVVMTALRKSPEERFADPQAFVQAFRRAITGADAVPAEEPARPMRALGIFVETEAEDGTLAHPDDALLDDVEDILVRAEYCLDAEGFRIARERSNALLFVRPLSGADANNPAVRRHAVTVAQHLFHRLARRPGRDPRVRLRVCVHEADVLVSGEELQGGPLLSLAEWLPSEWEEGVFGSPAVLSTALSTSEAPATRPPSWPGAGHAQRGARCARSAHGAGDAPATQRTREALAFSDTLPAFFAGMKPACLA